mmetsp:Transcript_23648/g.59575  ORF Transcript_23648/g.59575 Transcript_23648/m.59575 type:complete len:201 (+) Transcript_23648:305-907(+)
MFSSSFLSSSSSFFSFSSFSCLARWLPASHGNTRVKQRMEVSSADRRSKNEATVELQANPTACTTPALTSGPAMAPAENAAEMREDTAYDASPLPPSRIPFPILSISTERGTKAIPMPIANTPTPIANAARLCWRVTVAVPGRKAAGPKIQSPAVPTKRPTTCTTLFVVLSAILPAMGAVIAYTPTSSKKRSPTKAGDRW